MRLVSGFRFWAIGLLVLAVTLLCGCSDSSNPSAHQGPLVENGLTMLRKANGTEPQTLDPHRAEDVSSANILRDLYEGLALTGPDGGPKPGAAESWTMSDDGLRYVFHLRPTARWSNGDPVVAADFVAGMRRTVDPATGSNYGMILAPIAQAEAILAGQAKPDTLGVRRWMTILWKSTSRPPRPIF